VDPGGRYYNTTAQVSELEALVKKLPDPSTPLQPSPKGPVPGTVKKLGADQVQQLVAGYQAGASVYELGEQFGIDRKTVSRILHRHEVPMRRLGLSLKQVDEAVELYEEGWTTGQIGQRLRADPRTVQRRLRERGSVRMRDTHGRER
jgi:IS30 family transposase